MRYRSATLSYLQANRLYIRSNIKDWRTDIAYHLQHPPPGAYEVGSCNPKMERSTSTKCVDPKKRGPVKAALNGDGDIFVGRGERRLGLSIGTLIALHEGHAGAVLNCMELLI